MHKMIHAPAGGSRTKGGAARGTRVRASEGDSSEDAAAGDSAAAAGDSAAAARDSAAAAGPAGGKKKGGKRARGMHDDGEAPRKVKKPRQRPLQLPVKTGRNTIPGPVPGRVEKPEVSELEEMAKKMVKEMKQEVKQEIQEVKQEIERLKAASTQPKKGTTTYASYYHQNQPRTVAARSLPVAFKLKNVKISKVPTFSGMHAAENAKMLPSVWRALKALKGAKVHDEDTIQYGELLIFNTHKNPYLYTTAPDITAVPRGAAVHAYNCVFVIELQVGPLNNAHRGKAVSYCELMLRANPDRKMAVVVLTNTEQVEVFVSTRSGEDPGMVDNQVSSTMQMKEGESLENCVGWRWIVGLLQSTPTHLGYEVPQLDFKGERLHVTDYLGGGRGVKVYKVTKDKQDMACKAHAQEREGSFHRELSVLQAMKKRRRPKGLPVLKGYDQKTLLLLTTPVVKGIGTIHMNTARLRTLFSCLRFLHIGIGYLHRDLEPKHLGIAEGLLRLFDFSSSVRVGRNARGAARDGFSGTLLYASDDVLAAVEEGQWCEPHYRQDMVPLVKTVYALVHPSFRRELEATGETYADKPMTERIQAIRQCWGRELGKGKWKRLLDAAHFWHVREHVSEAEYDEVAKCLQKVLSLVVRQERAGSGGAG